MTITRPDITASVPLLEPPGWALAERALFDLLDHAWRRFARDFTGPDGRLTYRDTLTSRDGADDFYEVFFNWPQLYLLGGADDLLAESGRHWEGVTAQLTELGMLSGLGPVKTFASIAMSDDVTMFYAHMIADLELVGHRVNSISAHYTPRFS